MAVERSLLTRGLAVARLGIGVGIWLAPELSMKVLGFDPSNPQTMALARLTGTRDLALGALALSSAGNAADERRTLGLNALVDLGDAIAFGTALARREGIDRAAIGGALSAAAAAILGARLARSG